MLNSTMKKKTWKQNTLMICGTGVTSQHFWREKLGSVLRLKKTYTKSRNLILMLFFTKDQKVHSPRMSRIWSDLEDPTPLPGFLPHPRRSLEAALSVAPQTASWTDRRVTRPMDPAVFEQLKGLWVVVSWMKTQWKMQWISLFLCWWHLWFF